MSTRIQDTAQANLVKAILRLHGWTAQAIANKIGLSKCYVSLHTSGIRRNPDVQRKIARVIGVEPVSLFGTFLAASNTEPSRRKGQRPRGGGERHPLCGDVPAAAPSSDHDMEEHAVHEEPTR